MLSKKMEKLWNQFSDEDKAEIDARYRSLHAEYMTLQKSENTSKSPKKTWRSCW